MTIEKLLLLIQNECYSLAKIRFFPKKMSAVMTFFPIIHHITKSIYL